MTEREDNMKTITESAARSAVTYSGYSEMLLQEDYKKHTVGQYSDVVFVSSQNQHYVFGDITFEKVNVSVSE